MSPPSTNHMTMWFVTLPAHHQRSMVQPQQRHRHGKVFLFLYKLNLYFYFSYEYSQRLQPQHLMHTINGKLSGSFLYYLCSTYFYFSYGCSLASTSMTTTTTTAMITINTNTTRPHFNQYPSRPSHSLWTMAETATAGARDTTCLELPVSYFSLFYLFYHTNIYLAYNLYFLWDFGSTSNIFL